LFVAVVGLSSCNDSPLSPAEAGAIQMSETAMLASILSKLDSISAKLAEQEATFAARIDSLELAVTGGVRGGTVNAAAQVLLVEQLYRAATRLTGHPYHRE
jgi:hypothetical protein